MRFPVPVYYEAIILKSVFVLSRGQPYISGFSPVFMDLAGTAEKQLWPTAAENIPSGLKIQLHQNKLLDDGIIITFINHYIKHENQSLTITPFCICCYNGTG